MSLFGEILVNEIKYAFQDAHISITHNEYGFDDDVISHEGMFEEYGTTSYLGGSYGTSEIIVIGGEYYIEYVPGRDIVYFYSVKLNVKGFYDRDFLDIADMGYVKAINNIVSIIGSIMLDDDAKIFWN